MGCASYSAPIQTDSWLASKRQVRGTQRKCNRKVNDGNQTNVGRVYLHAQSLTLKVKIPQKNIMIRKRPASTRSQCSFRMNMSGHATKKKHSVCTSTTSGLSVATLCLNEILSKIDWIGSKPEKKTTTSHQTYNFDDSSPISSTIILLLLLLLLSVFLDTQHFTS